jgi:Flp pilus assembly pilin Flp
MNSLKAFWEEEEGSFSVELVLIIAALVAAALIVGRAILNFARRSANDVFGN